MIALINGQAALLESSNREGKERPSLQPIFHQLFVNLIEKLFSTPFFLLVSFTKTIENK